MCLCVHADVLQNYRMIFPFVRIWILVLWNGWMPGDDWYYVNWIGQSQTILITLFSKHFNNSFSIEVNLSQLLFDANRINLTFSIDLFELKNCACRRSSIDRHGHENGKLAPASASTSTSAKVTFSIAANSWFSQILEFLRRQMRKFELQPEALDLKNIKQNWIEERPTRARALGRLLEELSVDRLDHEVQRGADADQARHRVHRVVVDERRRVEGSRRHDSHQLRDGQSLGLDKRLRLAQIGAKDLLEPARVDLAKQIWIRKCNTWVS